MSQNHQLLEAQNDHLGEPETSRTFNPSVVRTQLFLLKKNDFIYALRAVLGLRGCTGFLSSCGEWWGWGRGLLSSHSAGLSRSEASLTAEHVLWALGPKAR